MRPLYLDAVPEYVVRASGDSSPLGAPCCAEGAEPYALGDLVSEGEKAGRVVSAASAGAAAGSVVPV